MKPPTLLVLAAGLGSRYGGIKQMDPVGPDGEFVLDYSLYDAWRAGFRSVVQVVRQEIEGPLREHLGDALDGRLEVAYVQQRLDDLPEGWSVPAGRTKPWGTGHAVRAARGVIDGPFAVINADDFYGAGAYREVARFLGAADYDGGSCCMVAYRLGNTLSDHGSVARGICRRDAQGLLMEVAERTCIERTETGARYRLDDGSWEALRGDEPASLNFWGFPGGIFRALEGLFVEFLEARGDDPVAEFFIPTALDALIRRGRCRTVMLNTDEHWFGMTYAEDRALVVRRVAELTRAGRYPAPLWG
ncbi:MAG: nucleotidyltransferase [Lentisphaeria bacterium]|nr:nucleotidyltransferase [Lentisphaeria bacterium]